MKNIEVKNQQNNQLLSVMGYNGSDIAFEEINGKIMINATQMAKPFGKTPKDWLRTQQAKDLVNVVAARHICLPTELQIVRNGGKNYGTFFQKNVALFFAQWLSPEFYLACNEKLEELSSSKLLNLPSKHGVNPIYHEGKVLYPYTDAVKAVGGSARSSASRRKANFPQHFVKLFGRNFITDVYFDILKSYYDYRNNCIQLKLELV